MALKSPHLRIAAPLLLLVVLFPRIVSGAACCVGGGPRGFINLKPLQSYEIGLASAYRSVYANYDNYGDLLEGTGNDTLTLTLGAGTRLGERGEIYGLVPFVYQTIGRGAATRRETGLGDVQVGSKWVLLQYAFQDDWYPAIYALAGVKLPTGKVEGSSQFGLVPGTGNGLWEPYAGLYFQKEIGTLRATVSVTYALRLGNPVRSVSRDGDRVDASETLTYPFSRRFSLGAGSNQSWTLGRYQNGAYIPESDGRTASLFITPTYFVTPYWSLTAVADYSLPWAGFGVNDQAAATFTVVSAYDFF